MKRILLSLLLTFITAVSFGQWGWSLDFENQSSLDRIVRDTMTNPNCKWQIGAPTKTVFTSAYTLPNAIVTDTINPVPPNDTSIFYIEHLRDQNQPFHIFDLEFWYQMDGDSTDFGTIELSPDTGHTWINLLIQDTTFQMYWNSPKPTLTGATNGWTWFNLNMENWASNWGSFPILMTADTILFRFTYVTDSGSTPHYGWMIDNINIQDMFEGIPEVQNDNLISIFPNPTSNELKIYSNKSSGNSRVQILNYTGQVIFDEPNFTGETIDTKGLMNGVYLLKYSSTSHFSVKEFVVQH